MDNYSDTLMIGLGARFFDFRGRLFVESQTVSGLKAWQENFLRIIAFSIAERQEPKTGWIDVEAAGLTLPEFEFVLLPDTYRVRTLRSARKQAEERLLDCMGRASYRVFSYGGWVGDPGEIAAALARRHKFSHAVWLDRVESQLVRQQSASNPIDVSKNFIKSKILSYHERRAVRTAELALLHGATVYSHFQNIARNPQISENIHLRAEDRIPHGILTAKIAASADGPLRILYCGRAEAMKGGLDWIQALARLKSAGVDFRAEWVGRGSQLEEMKILARSAGLNKESLSFPGFIADRQDVLQRYRRAQLFVFCHKTDESPRNLIESLHSATPIVGFRDAYATSLVREKGGGILVDRGDIEGLAGQIAWLAANRDALSDLIKKASQSANHLTQEQVFRERSNIVRRYLSL